MSLEGKHVLLMFPHKQCGVVAQHTKNGLLVCLDSGETKWVKEVEVCKDAAQTTRAFFDHYQRRSFLLKQQFRKRIDQCFPEGFTTQHGTVVGPCAPDLSLPVRQFGTGVILYLPAEDLCNEEN